MKSKCIALFLLFLSTFSFAQHRIYKEFGITDGLPSLEVHELYQDKNGLIWSATDRGMANYNGYEIQKFDLENHISNAVVLDMFPQANGKIYGATFNNQLFYFTDEFDGFQAYKYNDLLEEILEFKNHIISVYEDSDENLHIACQYRFGTLIISKEGEILQRNTKKWPVGNDNIWIKLEKKNDSTLFFSYEADSLIREKNSVKASIETTTENLAILLKESNYMIFTEGDTLYILDDKGTLVNTFKTKGKDPIVLKALSSTTFFVGYNFGGGVFMDINGIVKKRFFPNKSISGFLIDHEGGYWFSTLHSGIFYIKEPDVQTLEAGRQSPVSTLAKTKNNDLYIGYRTGKVLKLDTHKNITLEVAGSNTTPRLQYDADTELLYVKSGYAFYTKNSSGERSFFNDSLSDSYYIKMAEPLEKKFMATNQNGFVVMEENTAKQINIDIRANDVAFWKDTYYVGTPLGVYTVKNDQKKALSEIHPLFNSRVDDIDVNTARNEVYFATLESGIIIYNVETGEIRNVTVSEGLSSNMINEVYVENENELWVCTNAGLNKIRFTADDTFRISGLKSAYGLLDDGINDVEVINDTVWIASKKGLMYAPRQLFDTPTTPKSYHLRVKSIRVNDSLVPQETLQNLSHTENRIEFFVEGIHFKAPNELQYTYTIEGLDTKWYDTKNRRISYSALPYGNYTFKVAAKTSQHEAKSVCIEIPITIHAPFWKQAWFVITVIVAIIALIYLFFKYRILSYNRHIIRELLRLLMKKIKRKELYFSFKEAGKEIRIKTDTILYIKSAGNYVEVITEKKNYTIRTKIGEFINLMPDPLEYLRIHRSYIVRIDKVAEKNNKEVTVNGQKIPVSNSYVDELQKLIF